MRFPIWGAEFLPSRGIKTVSASLATSLQAFLANESVLVRPFFLQFSRTDTSRWIKRGVWVDVFSSDSLSYHCLDALHDISSLQHPSRSLNFRYKWRKSDQVLVHLLISTFLSPPPRWHSVSLRPRRPFAWYTWLLFVGRRVAKFMNYLREGKFQWWSWRTLIWTTMPDLRVHSFFDYERS